MIKIICQLVKIRSFLCYKYNRKGGEDERIRRRRFPSPNRVGIFLAGRSERDSKHSFGLCDRRRGSSSQLSCRLRVPRCLCHLLRGQRVSRSRWQCNLPHPLPLVAKREDSLFTHVGRHKKRSRTLYFFFIVL